MTLLQVKSSFCLRQKKLSRNKSQEQQGKNGMLALLYMFWCII